MMDVPLKYIAGGVLVLCIATTWIIGYYWHTYMTPPGRKRYAEILHRRIDTYDEWIFEIVLADTAAAVACSDIDYLSRTRQRKLRQLRRWRCQAKIVLFYFHCRS